LYKNRLGTVKFFNGKQILLEMHKVRIVQSLKLVPVERRLEAMAVGLYETLEE
jgi:tryptophanase